MISTPGWGNSTLKRDTHVVLAPRVDRDIELALSHLDVDPIGAERLVVSDPAVTGEGQAILVDDREHAERHLIADGAHPSEDERTVGEPALALHRLSRDPVDVDLVVFPQPGEQGPIAWLIGPQVVVPVLHPVPVVPECLPKGSEQRHGEVTGRALHAVFPGKGGYA